jgi:membrane protease YdiL (CAAX protease family)
MTESKIKSGKTAWKVMIHCLLFLAIMLTVDGIVALAGDKVAELMGYTSDSIAAFLFYGIMRVIVGYGVAYLYLHIVFKFSIAEFRIKKPISILPWVIIAVLLPFCVVGFFLAFIRGNFFFYSVTQKELHLVITYAVVCSCFGAGFTEELWFRGGLMHFLEIRFGRVAAVLVPSVLFGLIHVLNLISGTVPFGLMDVLQLICAGSLVGMMFSIIAIAADSVFMSAIVHGIWNLVIIGQIIAVAPSPAGIITYVIESESTLLNGGALGIEASVPATIGYVVVIVIALIIMKSKQKTITAT